MADLLKVFIGAIYAWAFPSGLALAIFWLLAFTQLDLPLVAKFAALPDGAQLAILLGGAATLGLVLNALSTPLYRVLEGYLWPEPLRRWGVGRQHKIKVRLCSRPEGTGWRRGLRIGQVARFPLRDEQIAPTRLGNALRAMETYGKTRFNLDSQTMWNELWAAAPQALRDEIDRARASTDFCVALVYLSLAFSVAALIAGVADGYDRLVLIEAAIAFGSSFLWYWVAVASTDNWRYAVRALVNTGRLKVADALNLKLPDSLAEERRMWGLVTAFVYFAKDDEGNELDFFRKVGSESDAEDDEDAEEPMSLALRIAERME